MKRIITAVLAAAALLLSAAALKDARRDRDAPGHAETMSQAVSVTESEAPREEYLLSEVSGRVAVFRSGDGERPREITAIQVALLPSADRRELRSGISAAGEVELAMLLEDLGS